MSGDIEARSRRALEKLGKWRGLLAGWHLGTHAIGAPGVAAMRDLREAVLMLRVEVNALVTLLAQQKRVFTEAELVDMVGKEAALKDAELAQRFPGYRTSATGLVIHDVEAAAETARRLGFPP